MDYELIDSGNGRKLERFGNYLLDRPASHALWKKNLEDKEWLKADAIFTREGKNNWQGLENLPKSWEISVIGIRFKLMPTEFGHLGIFPEQQSQWRWMQNTIQAAKQPLKILNLFAYSGGATLACAKAGASVCHLDASKGMVFWARENCELNHLQKAPVRWIVDDVTKFLKRESKRQIFYDGIILDPPSFGRGAKGEVFKIEEHLPNLLELCRELLSQKPLFVLLSCHTPGITPVSLQYLLQQMLKKRGGEIECGEMLLEGKPPALSLPSGTFARWTQS